MWAIPAPEFQNKFECRIKETSRLTEKEFITTDSAPRHVTRSNVLVSFLSEQKYKTSWTFMWGRNREEEGSYCSKKYIRKEKIKNVQFKMKIWNKLFL